MLPAWLTIAIIFAFPAILALGYALTSIHSPTSVSGRPGFVLYIVFLCLPLSAALATAGPSLTDALAPPPWPWLLLALLSVPALALVQLILPGKPVDGGEKIYTGPPDTIGFFSLMPLIAFIVLAEELIWRAFLQPYVTLIPASIAFALHHFHFGWRHVLFSFLAGLVWGLLFWLSGSLWPSVLSHLLYNALAWWVMRQAHSPRSGAAQFPTPKE
jgi:membrane protease YdiL (CAAX protease family)